MKPMLQFLNRTKSFLFVHVYPYFAWVQDPTRVDLSYAIFESDLSQPLRSDDHESGIRIFGSGSLKRVGPITETTTNEVYKGNIWCVVAKGANWTQLGDALSYACEPIQTGGPCYKPDLTVLHASNAFSSYWASFRKTGGTCSFNGLATQTIKDSSFGRCEFPSVTL
ncbi:unnamed protein product [Cochlearia groenlandica]